MNVLSSIYVLFILCNSNIRAENIPLPSSVLDIEDLVSEFRSVFASKLVDLGKNYISQMSDKHIVYKSSENLMCNGIQTRAGMPVSSLKYHFSNSAPNELVEKAIYTGCNDLVSLVEEVVTKGESVIPLNFNDFIRGKRTIDLKENETSRLYRILNGENEEIFKIMIEKSERLKSANFYFVGEKFLTITYEYTPTSSSAYFMVHSYAAKYNRKRSSWRSINNSPPVSFSVHVTRDRIDQVSYLDGERKQLSLSNFLNLFDNKILGPVIYPIRGIMNYHNYYFPNTETTNTGAASQRLLEELRINQNRLINNIELNIVKTYIQNLINSVESGKIIDNRPKDQ